MHLLCCNTTDMHGHSNIPHFLLINHKICTVHIYKMEFFSDLANEVWDPKCSVNLLQAEVVWVAEEGVELVKQSSLVTLPFSGGWRNKQIIQWVAKRQAEHTKKTEYKRHVYVLISGVVLSGLSFVISVSWLVLGHAE